MALLAAVARSPSKSDPRRPRIRESRTSAGAGMGLGIVEIPALRNRPVAVGEDLGPIAQRGPTATEGNVGVRFSNGDYAPATTRAMDARVIRVQAPSLRFSKTPRRISLLAVVLPILSTAQVSPTVASPRS